MRNVARGVVPTFTGFADANPADLANATDGDLSTFTSTGTKITIGAGDVGFFNFAVSPGTYLVSAKVGMWTSAGTLSAYIYGDDIVEHTFGNALVISLSNAVESIRRSFSKVVCVSTGVLTLSFYSSAAATSNVRLYDFKANKIED